jgi:hypothetical protein
MPRAGTYIRASDFATSDHVPVAPPDWPEHRRARFDRIARSRPAGWWDSSNEGLLIEYVTAVESSERLRELIDQLDIDTVPAAELNRILSARDREAKRALSLARSMRLTPLSLPMPREGSFTPADESTAPWSA